MPGLLKLYLHENATFDTLDQASDYVWHFLFDVGSVVIEIVSIVDQLIASNS